MRDFQGMVLTVPYQSPHICNARAFRQRNWLPRCGGMYTAESVCVTVRGAVAGGQCRTCLDIFPSCGCLARQAALIDLEVQCVDKTDVRWHTVASRECYNVARDNFISEDVDRLAISEYGG